MIGKRVTAAFVALMVAWAWIGGKARGDDVQVTASLALGGKYDNGESNSVAVAPGLSFTRRTEIQDLRLSAVLSGVRYADGQEKVDQSYQGDWSYRLTPRLQVQANGSYITYSDPQQNVPQTGQFLTKATRVSERYGATTTYSLSEISSVSLAGSVDRENSNAAGATDVDAKNVSVGYLRDLGDYLSSTTGGVNLGYGHYRFSNSEVDNLWLTVGGGRSFTERLKLEASLGVRQTRTQYQQLEQRIVVLPPFAFLVTEEKEKRSTEWGGVGSLALTYSGVDYTGGLTFSRDLQISADNGVTDRTSLVLNLSHRFTWELTGSFDAGYYENKSQQGQTVNGTLDERTLRAACGLTYALSQHTSLEAGGSLARVEYRNGGGSENRAVLTLTLRFSYPVIE